jgi:hypothetical protein
LSHLKAARAIKPCASLARRQAFVVGQLHQLLQLSTWGSCTARWRGLLAHLAAKHSNQQMQVANSDARDNSAGIKLAYRLAAHPVT